VLVVTFQYRYILLKRQSELDRMYVKRDKRQIKSNNKLDHQHELEFC